MASAGVLPEDSLVEILLRLPVKSLVRFRCVSKSWFAFLKSPYFIDMHLKFSLARDDENLIVTRFLIEENKNLLSIHSNDESLNALVPNLELQGYSDESLHFIGSCNGIVCLSSFHDLILFNPAIREFRTLPPLPSSYRTEGMGFGFDPASNDYKVVKITWISYDCDDFRYNCFGSDPPKAEIYNLSTDTWRELDVLLPMIMTYAEGSFDLLFNGKIHWHAADDEELILSFDISTEVFHKFQFPEANKTIMDEEVLDYKSLLVIQDTLALILYTYRDSAVPHPYEQFINIWLMKEYGVEESWSKQYAIGPLSGILRPLSVSKNAQLFLERTCNRRGDVDAYGYDSQLVGCDLLNDEQLQEYDVYGSEDTLGVVFYKETLLSVTRT